MCSQVCSSQNAGLLCVSCCPCGILLLDFQCEIDAVSWQSSVQIKEVHMVSMVLWLIRGLRSYNTCNCCRSLTLCWIILLYSWLAVLWTLQGDHLSGKPENIREFERDHGKVGEKSCGNCCCNSLAIPGCSNMVKKISPVFVFSELQQLSVHLIMGTVGVPWTHTEFHYV